jgi:hypothetical protein
MTLLPMLLVDCLERHPQGIADLLPRPSFPAGSRDLGCFDLIGQATQDDHRP